MKPASEYPKRGDKTKAVSDAERHFERTSRTTDAGNRGRNQPNLLGLIREVVKVEGNDPK
jgi:hypothetical protein